MPRYSCALNGQCEEDANGLYDDIKQCQLECQAVDAKDLQYIIFSYIPVEARVLAPSDRVELIHRLIGVWVEPSSSYVVLGALEPRRPEILIQFPELLSWLLTQHQWQELRHIIIQSGNLDALKVLLTRDNLNYDEKETFIVASDYDFDTLDFFYRREPAFLQHVLTRLMPDIRARGFLVFYFKEFGLATPQVLDYLSSNGFDDFIKSYENYFVDEGRGSIEIIQWYLTHYTSSILTTERIKTAIYRNNITLLQVVRRMFPDKALHIGRLVLKDVVAKPILPRYQTFPQRVAQIQQLAKYLWSSYYLPEITSAIQQLWYTYLISIIKTRQIKEWINMITYYYTEKPSWSSIETICKIGDEYWSEFREFLRELLSGWNKYSTRTQRILKRYLKDCNLAPSGKTVLTIVPELAPDFPPSDEEIEEVLASGIKLSATATAWISKRGY